MDKNDLKQIGDLMDKKFKDQDAKFDKRFKDQDTKFDKKFDNFEKKMSVLIDVKLDSKLEKLEQKMFDWKSEIVDAVDVFAKEISISRESRAIASYRTADNTGRIEKLEERI